nr:MAG TPA: hypothetical protein [Caudoviricetes sp.]
MKEVAMIILRWLIPAVYGGVPTGFDDATYFAEV